MDGIPVTGVSELVLEVDDLEAAERFYAGVLGFPFVGIAGGRGGAHVHYAFHIAEEDYDAAIERLREHGYEPEEHRFDAYKSSRAAYVSDPDGNVVELWTWDVARHLER